MIESLVEAVRVNHGGPTDEGDCWACPETWPCSAEQLADATRSAADLARSVCIDWSNDWPIDESQAADLLKLLEDTP